MGALVVIYSPCQSVHYEQAACPKKRGGVISTKPAGEDEESSTAKS